MFLQLAHTRLDIYVYSEKLVLECYSVTKQFPNDEKFALVQQIRRAALSVHLNIAEDSSRNSQRERKRFYEIARGSLIEVDAATGIALKLSYVAFDEIKPLETLIIKTFKMLSGLIRQASIRP